MDGDKRRGPLVLAAVVVFVLVAIAAVILSGRWAGPGATFNGAAFPNGWPSRGLLSSDATCVVGRVMDSSEWFGIAQVFVPDVMDGLPIRHGLRVLYLRRPGGLDASDEEVVVRGRYCRSINAVVIVAVTPIRGPESRPSIVGRGHRETRAVRAGVAARRSLETSTGATPALEIRSGRGVAIHARLMTLAAGPLPGETPLREPYVVLRVEIADRQKPFASEHEFEAIVDTQTVLWENGQPRPAMPALGSDLNAIADVGLTIQGESVFVDWISIRP